MYDPAVHRGTNLCSENKGNCSHLCLPVSKNRRVCKCSIGYTNDPKDETKCIGNLALITLITSFIRSFHIGEIWVIFHEYCFFFCRYR